MLTLGIAHVAETADRIRDPLAARDIAVEHISLTGTVTDLGNAPTQDVDVGLFFPSRLVEGGVLTARLGIPWVNGRDAVSRSRSKAETVARLEAADVPVPETMYISDPVDQEALAAAFESLDPPVVIKPNSTTRGQGVLQVDDLDSLLGASDYLDLLHQFPGTRDRSYLLQEYVPQATDIRVMVIDGDVVGAVKRSLPESARDAGRWKHNVHRGAEATAIDPPEPVRKLAERTADVLDIPVLGVDVLKTADRVLVLETNARPTIDEESKYDAQFYDRLADAIRKRAPDNY